MVTTPRSSYREIAKQCWMPPEEFRVYQESVAHGVGLQVEFPLLCHRDDIALMPYPDEVLHPGMVLRAESYIGAVGGREGVKLEQQVLITEAGPKLFQMSPLKPGFCVKRGYGQHDEEVRSAQRRDRG